MNEFLYGALAMAAAVVALLFARAWRLDGDRLFLFFTAAFAILAANWVVIAVATPSDETRYFLYLPRLVAFGLIIVGIAEKNRRHRRSRPPGRRGQSASPASGSGGAPAGTQRRSAGPPGT